jgi:hypothetical protein
MLFYDFRRLHRKFGHSPKQFRANLTKLKGTDFIVNEDYVLKNPQGLSLRNLMLYLELCSYRNYYDYVTSEKVNVPIMYLEDVEKFKPLIGKSIAITTTEIILLQE